MLNVPPLFESENDFDKATNFSSSSKHEDTIRWRTTNPTGASFCTVTCSEHLLRFFLLPVNFKNDPTKANHFIYSQHKVTTFMTNASLPSDDSFNLAILASLVIALEKMTTELLSNLKPDQSDLFKGSTQIFNESR